MAKDYTSTLNLPKTDFPMRANLPQREPEMQKAWEDEGIYEQMLKRNADKPSFILHDGPPFSNGNIHMGTAMNKVLKDFINKYKSMHGFRACYRPGWDNHGMPIESAIIKQSKLDRKKMTVPEFRDACHEFAQNFVNIQMDQFKRLGVLGEWDDPYLTMKPEFEAREIRVFGEMYKKGYIYKGLKPVYWCPHDETALAEAEIDYKDIYCTSIYVKFRISDTCGNEKMNALDLANTYFVIWTTTAWTLPGNLAIAVHPREEYIAAKVPSGEIYILAAALAEKTLAAAGIDGYETLASFTGSELEYMKARHPFLDRDSVLLCADYVTMESGTGCVHTAPGFGADDYMTCKRYKMDMIVPVDDRGYQTEDAGPYAGMYYEESGERIIADMRESGALLASEQITHSYPHCWRCKHPIIFRATPQWFCSVEAFKDEAVRACDDVTWTPAWGRERMIGMIRERADWCISRQRHWGLPIAVFYCKDCGEVICNDETIDNVSRLFAEHGSNVWYEKEASELLPEGFVCPKCGSVHITKETDTLDGWFDSGCTHFVNLEDREGMRWPADLYLEGADQFRGWFQSSLLTAVGAKGQGAPYRGVLTHGWVVDGEGKAMHKSLGNSVLAEDVVKKYGADILRAWVASSDYQVDVRVSDKILGQLGEIYRKIRNTARILLANLGDFDPDNDMLPVSELEDIDKWIIAGANELAARSVKNYDEYDFHGVFHDLANFCTVDLSKLYIDITKDRSYVEAPASKTRRAVQTAMYTVLSMITRILAPLLTFTADEIWRAMPHVASEDARSVLLNDIPTYDESLTFPEIKAHWDHLFELRDDVMKELETARANKLIGKSLEAQLHITASGEQYAVLDSFRDQLAAIFIVSAVSLESGEGEMKVTVEPASGEKCDRCWMFTEDGETTEDGHLCARCMETVKGL
ncbi:MAG: isoleucine--tRNA ligase [Christensenellales bacterium]|jgi:isoleucine--tRNA ligase|nr:MAG: isoleucine--tRNA ligase [Oscillospiraceae bacterium]